MSPEENLLQNLKDTLVQTYQPRAVFLFGSRVWGQPSPQSDYDFLVVVPASTETTYTRMLKGTKALHKYRVSKDIMVYTDEEYKKLANDETTLCYKISHEGKLLYGTV